MGFNIEGYTLLERIAKAVERIADKLEEKE